MKRDRLRMFHRRLILLMALGGAAIAVCAGQMVRLASQRDGALAEAEARLQRATWIPTRRGAILDRHGRILAEDRPSFEVRVRYDVIDGSWPRREGVRLASGHYYKAWQSLSSAERDALARPYVEALSHHLDALWKTIESVTGADALTLARRRMEIIERVARERENYLRNEAAARAEALRAKGRAVTPEQERALAEDLGAYKRVASELQTHAIVPHVGDDAAFELMRLVASDGSIETPDPRGEGRASVAVPRLPGVEVVDRGRRSYPRERMVVAIDQSTLPGPLRLDGHRSITVDGVACHVLGWMRDEHWKEDRDRRQSRLESDPAFRARALTPDGVDRGEYRLGDAVGAAGLEREQESLLRGLRGYRVERLDSGVTLDLPPEPGRDVRLTLDIELQAHVQALMTPELGLAAVQDWNKDAENDRMPIGSPINGAAVVIEIDTGDILAMVSTPTFTREQAARDWSALARDDLNAPIVNRAIAKRYAPGSIVKALMLASAMTRGLVLADERIACTGHFLPTRTDVMRCWIYKHYGNLTHSMQLGHDLLGRDALMVSCNIYFFTLGQRLGVEGVRETYRAFGVGSPWNLGVGEEYAGNLGRWADDGRDLTDATDAIFMAIGQGPVDWTPLHAADAYATLARAGTRLGPRLIADRRPAVEHAGMTAAAIREALVGLALAVGDARYGTGHHITVGGVREPIFNARGIRVWGKTGTADAGRTMLDPDGDGPEPRQPIAMGDHSWFVVLAGPDAGEASRPEYAIAVVMDHAGSGGRVSGPIANQIVHALIAHGYLPNRSEPR